MAKRVGIEVSHAVSHAAKLAKVDVVSAYPITPQTHIVEDLAEMVASGELDAAFIPVESEHSAMSACLGSSAVGARTFTATSSQGLILMHEVLFVASAMQFPIVTAVANRTLSAPISIYCDHSDVMATRDTGWIQIFALNGQEAFDGVICGFKIAEDNRVLLPLMLNLDGFQLTHVVEPIKLMEQEEVDRFLPRNNYPLPLNPDKPVSMGCYAIQFNYFEAKRAQHENLVASKEVILECWKDFGDLTGRYYSPLDCYKCEGAKVLLLTMGSLTETAIMAINSMREDGEKVGLINLRLWRPFPYEELYEAVKDVETLVVLDRALSFGGPGGPVCSEIRSALYGLDKKPKVIGFVGALGGRDIFPDGFREIVHKAVEIARSDSNHKFEIYGVRE